ncbi:hypothetical protein IAE33_000974 [Pseudomonas sp. S60]|uniref:hypothetical protein n=1 Tax=unclassified Pseudomonas TaxID=196821 RepID=UPI001912CE3B|nr:MULTISPECIES: hypothetical protein [unclassified Pseudomonas]MBK5004720.1 hypothetical protein [Pseudomonas sp. S32]MBK5009114.1 hypothetical protein [Pseudomonas sp. S60]
MTKCTDFVAYNQTAGGKQSFRVSGTVTVPSPAFEPVLVVPEIRHYGGWEVLHLQLVDTGETSLAVMTEKTVEYVREGACPWSIVEIIHSDGSLKVEIEATQACD